MEPLPLIALVGLGVAGLLVGSFLNVVIVRVPDREPLLTGWRCTACEAPIRPADGIPVLSWLLLRGRCRACGEEIGFAYVLVEVATAALWVLAGVRFGPSWALVPMLLLVSTLLAQSVIDLETSRLPDRINIPVLGASVVLIGIVSAVEGDPGRVGVAIGGGIGYALFLFLPALLSFRGKQAMGLGDVKLGLILGLYLAWLHPVLILFSLIIASVAGAVVGGILFVVRRRSDHYPFGPWLALGCLLALLFSEPLLDVYLLDAPAFLAGPGTF
ncbi:MAG TPA: prepilin peptidase [Iamia sp.]|nr:prepilin peptidase [Iamia sp.]